MLANLSQVANQQSKSSAFGSLANLAGTVIGGAVGGPIGAQIGGGLGSALGGGGLSPLSAGLKGLTSNLGLSGGFDPVSGITWNSGRQGSWF